MCLGRSRRLLSIESVHDRLVRPRARMHEHSTPRRDGVRLGRRRVLGRLHLRCTRLLSTRRTAHVYLEQRLHDRCLRPRARLRLDGGAARDPLWIGGKPMSDGTDLRRRRDVYAQRTADVCVREPMHDRGVRPGDWMCLHTSRRRDCVRLGHERVQRPACVLGGPVRGLTASDVHVYGSVPCSVVRAN